MVNLKTLPPEILNQEVNVTLKPASESSRKYGRTLTGFLTARIWQERFDKGYAESTVIGITLNLDGKEVNLWAAEIEDLEKSTFLA